jgi:glycosyltransferase involved in cell wall biosynthesis
MAIRGAPAVTVLLPVYNGEKFLRPAIDSVLAQTYRNFELLIINDGSSDGTEAIIQSYRDDRIVYVRNEQNLRLIATLNRGLDLARGVYVARMDADDVSRPQRLERQVGFMDANPGVAASGSAYQVLAHGLVVRRAPLPTDPQELKCRSLFHCPLAHPTVIMRRDVLREASLRYPADYPHSEDYALWVRLQDNHQLANLPEALVKIRVHPGQVTQKYPREKQATVRRIHQEVLGRIGLMANAQEAEIHYTLYEGRSQPDPGFIAAAEAWLLRIVAANAERKYFDTPTLDETVLAKWATTCGNWGRGPQVLRRFFASPLCKKELLTSSARLRLYMKILLRYRQH